MIFCFCGGLFEKSPPRPSKAFLKIIYVFFFFIPKKRFKNGLKNAGERTNTIFICSPLDKEMMEFQQRFPSKSTPAAMTTKASRKARIYPGSKKDSKIPAPKHMAESPSSFLNLI